MEERLFLKQEITYALIHAIIKYRDSDIVKKHGFHVQEIADLLFDTLKEQGSLKLRDK